MKQWKINQEIYHRLNTIHDDDLNNLKYEITDNVVEYAVKYFTDKDIGWIYPSKSYMVAICYAKWLSQIYGGKELDYLNEDDLLYSNDPYFVPYDQDSQTYDKILNEIGGWFFDESKGIVPDVRQYFVKEFMLNE